MKILKKSFPKFLSLCKVFGTATLLFFGNPSQGFGLTGNSVCFSRSELSSNVVADLNNVVKPAQMAIDETANLFSNPTPAPDPIDATVCEGANASFSVTGGANYQWEYSSNGGSTWNPVGTSSPTLTLTGVTLSMNGYLYRCIIDLGAPSNPATLTVNSLPVISTASTASICSGASPNITLISSVPSSFAWTVGTITGGITGASAGSGLTINQTLTNPSNLTAGTVEYLVTPTSTAGPCVGSPYTITVTVNPIPVVTNSPNAVTCSGTGPNVALTSSTPSSFAWTVGTITGGITGASASSGTSINQILTNPSNLTAGTVEYLVTPTSTSGSCVGSPYTITVTVNPTPIVTNPVTANICSGTSPNITLISSVPSSFAWTVGTITGGITGASASSGTSINQILTNPSNLTAGTVEYLVTPTSLAGSCVGSPYTITVTVNPIPVVTNSPNAITCSGTGPNITLTSSTPSSFTWTIGTITGGITGASAGSGATINQVLTNPSNLTAGTVEYFVTPTSTAGPCVGSPYTITLTVNPIPIVTNSPNAITCSGTGPNITLTSSTPSSFAWTIGTITGGITGASAGSGSTINQVLTNPSNVTAGTIAYLVTPTAIAGSCPGTPFTITVTVNPAPIVTNSPTASTCSGAGPNITLTSSTPSSFAWTTGTITGGITGASAGSGSTINQILTNPSNATNGTVEYLVTPTSTLGSCVGTPYAITVTVNPTPVITNPSTASICNGTGPNITLTSSAPSSFAWTIGAITGGITGASAGSGAMINQTLTNPSNVTAGTVEYLITPTSTSGSCVGSPYTITITVNPTPIVTNSPVASTCSGSGPNITLSSSVPSSFSWTIGTITGGIIGASAGSGGTINQILTNPSNLSSGTVAYLVTPTALAGSCAASPFTITVTVDPAPVVTNPATASTCSGSSPNITLTSSTPCNFSWTIGTITGGITGASAASGTTINQTLTNPGSGSAGTVAYIVTPTSVTGSCPGSPFTITVTVNPAPTVTNSSTARACGGTGPNITLTASVPSSFSWTIGTITGGITGASAGSGATINQTLVNPSNVTSGTVAYLVTPTSTSGLCVGTPYTITVTVDPAPIVTNSPTANICSGTGPNINLTSSTPSSFSWTIGTITGGITGASSGSGLTINQLLTNPSNATIGTVAYLVTPTSIAGSCPGTPYTITVTVNPAPTVTNSATTSTCSGTGPNISLTSSVTSSFSWTIGTITGGITGASAGSGAIINQTLTNPGSGSAGTVDYIITPTSIAGSCPGIPYTITVTVNPAPAVTNASTASTCSGTGPNITLTSSVPSNFSWTIGTITGGITGASAGSGATINQILTNPGSGSAGTVAYIVTPTSIAGSCPGAPYTIVVTVNPAPAVTNPVTANICSGSGPNINLTSSAPSSFSWTIGTITGGITGASSGSGPTINQLLTNPGNSAAGTVAYLVTPSATTGSCMGAPYTITVKVNPAPAVTNSAVASTCSGTGPNITLTSSSPSSFAWTIGTISGSITGASAGFGGTINQILTNPSNSTAGTVDYIVTPTSTTGLCVGAPFTITVTVNPAPVLTTPGTITICSGTSPNMALTASTPSTFAWTIGTITGGITGASSGSGSIINQTLTNPSSPTGGTVEYHVIPTSIVGSCAGVPYTITVIVNPMPVVTNAATASTCSGASPNIALTSSSPSSFAWTIGSITGGITGASPGFGSTINQILNNPSSVSSGTVTYIVTPTATAGSCIGTPFTIVVTVNPIPVIMTPGTITICNGTGPNLALTASTPSTFSWTIGTITGGITGASSGSGSTINQILTNPSNASTGTVDYIVTPVSTAGSCNGTPFTIMVTVKPSPILTTPNTAAICSGTGPNISLSASEPSSFSWTIGTITGGITGGGSGSGANINQTLTNPSSTVAGTVEYLVTPTSATGSCAIFPITVTVNPTPIVTIPSTSTICNGTSPNISLVASIPSNFSWSIGTITGGISGANPGSGSTINQTLTNPSSASAGTVDYIVTPTSTAGLCTGSPFTITVTVNPDPVVLTANSAIICSGTSPNIKLTATAPSNFAWTIGAITGGITGAIPGAGTTINQILTNPGNSAAGTVEYLVTPTSSTGSCAGVPYTITVTVNPTPTVTNPGTANICSGTSPNITLTSSAPSSFAWTVGTITGGITGASASSGASINQTLTNPSNSTAGTVAYIITPTSTAGLCTGAPYTITVTVNPTPIVTNSPTANTCSGTGPNITLTSSTPSSFSWTIGTITGGVTGASAGSGPKINQILSYPGNASAGTVAYIITPTSLTGSCIGTPFTITVTVQSTPDVTTPNTATICSGTSPVIALAASAPSNFTWTIGTITGGITGASASSGSVINQILTNPSNTSAGTVEYFVTPTAISGSCPGSPYTITVTVNPIPTITTPNTASICSGASSNLNLTSSLSSTFTWTVGTITGGITGASAGSGITINQTLTNPSNSAAGTVAYIVTPTSTTGSCKGAPYTITVTVNPTPIVTNSPTVNICSGTSPNINLSASTPSNFAWTIGTINGGITGASAGFGSTINQVLTNPSNGASGTVTYIVTPTSTSGACAGIPFAITVTVNPAPVVLTPNTATICSGTSSNITLTSSAPSNFTWTIGTISGGITGATAGSGSVINQILSNPSNAIAGTVEYLVTPISTLGLCHGTPYAITVTVNPAPVVTTLNTAAICSGSSANISLTSSGPSNFTWTIGAISGGITGAAAGSGSTINQPLTNPSNITAGTVVYLVTPTAIAGSCVGTPYPITVTVNPKPIITNSPTASTCSGTSPNISLVSSVPSNFTWTIGTITGGITGASAGSGTAINQTLTNPSNVSAGTVAYIVTPTSTAGSCPGVPFTITVTVHAAPAVTALSTATICSGTNTDISLTATIPSTFTWTVGANTGGITGATAGSGSAINQVLFNPSGTSAGSIEYLVTPTSNLGSCPGTPYTITVTVNPAPVVTTPGSATICSGTSPNINLTASIASSFSWTIGTVSGGITGASVGSGSIINQTLINSSNTTTGIVEYLVTPTSSTGSCSGSVYMITVTVNPSIAVTNSPTRSTCSGTSPNIILTSNVPSNFAWTVGAITGGITGASSGSGTTINQILTNPSNTTAGTVAYIVTPTSSTGTCIGAPYTITVTVNPIPVVTTTSTSAVCSGASTNINLAATAASTFSWTIGTISGGITGAGSGSGSTINQILANPSNAFAGTVEYLVTPTSITGLCTGATYTITVTVHPTPTVTNSPAINTCSGTSPNINLTASAPCSFSWVVGTVTGGIIGASSGSGPTINQILTNPSHVAAGTVAYIVTPLAITGSCVAAPYTIVVTVNPAPIVTNSPTANTCSGVSPNIALTSSVPSSFTWTIGAITGGITGASSGSGSAINQILTNPGNTLAGTVAYLVTPTSTTGSCAGIPYTITVTVNPVPAVTTPATITVCSGTSPNIPLTATSPSNFTWTIGTITGGITGASIGSGSTINQILSNPGNTMAGTVEYIVTPTAITGSCAGNPYTITVTVNPTPAITTASTSAICNGTSPNISLTASVPSSFSWTIGAITGNITGAGAGSGAFINQILSNPSKTTAGTVVYIVTPTSTTDLCMGPAYSITVTVNPAPVVTTPPTATICSGISPNISLTSSVPSTFAWTVGTITGGITGAGAGSGSTINQILTSPSNSTGGTVAYIVTPTSITGSCTGAAYTITVVVNPAPVVTTASSVAICSGTGPDLALNSSVSSNFAWTVGSVTGGITGASPGSGSTINQILTNPSNSTEGTVAYIVVPTSAVGSCSGNPYTITVTVNPVPVVTTPNTVTICSKTGSNIALTASIPSSFVWTIGTITGGITGASSGSGTMINQILTNPSNVTAGSVEYHVTPTSLIGSCVAGADYVITVTVNPVPVVTTPNTATICSATSPNINLAASAPSNFTWSVGAITGGITGASAGSGGTIDQILTNPSNSSSGTVEYLVTSISKTGLCTGVSYAITVTVKPATSLTSAAFSAICSGSTFNYTPTASILGTTFSWSRALTPDISNPAASGTGDPNETLVNTSTSPVNVTYIYTLTADGCTNTANVVVTVNPIPRLSSSLTPPAICNNTPFSYTPTSLTAGTSFTWIRNSIAGISNTPSAGVNNPGETLINTTNVPVNVAYVYNLTANGCANVQNVTVAVNPSPVLTSSLIPPAICSNSAFSYTPTSSTPGTISYTWNRAAVPGISNLAASGNGNPNEILFNTTTVPVNVTYVYTLSVAGCANPTTFNVVVSVNPIPSLNSSLTPAPICSGSLFTYNAASSTASTIMTWIRQSVAGISQPASSGTGNINEFLTNATPLPINVTYVYTSTLNGCSNIQNVVVTVNPIPILSSNLTVPVLCSGSTFTYSATSTTPGATFAWSRAAVPGILEAGTSGTGFVNEMLTNTTTAPIQVSYVYTVSANGCTNPVPYNVVVTVYPAPPTPVITPSGSISFCAGSSATLSAPPGYTYQWSNGATTQSIEVNNTGSYSVIVTDATGCHSAPSAPVLTTVSPSATVSSGADGSVCEGTNFVVSGAFALNYSTLLWTSSGSGTFSGNGTIAPTYTPSAVDILNGSVILTLTADNISPCAGSMKDDMVLTIQSAPTANAGADNTICYPNSFLVAGVASNYTNPIWDKGSAAGVLLGANTLTPTYFPDVSDIGNTVTLTLTVEGKTPCTTTATDFMQLRVDALPANPGVISGISPVCKSVTTTYSVAPISYATDYIWTLPLGATIVSGNHTNNIQVTFGATAVSGNISVYGTNACGNGIVSTLPVTVNDVPLNPGSISGNAQVCQGATGVNYSISPVAGATSFVWTVPTGATITSTLPYTNTITVDFGPTASSGNVTVSAVGDCGNGPVSTKSIVLNSKPATPIISATGSPVICEGNSVPLVGTTAGYHYFWTPGGATSQVNMATVTGDYSVVVTDPATGCSSDPSNTVSVTVNPAPNPPTSIGFVKECWNSVAPIPTLDASTVTNVSGASTIVWYDAAVGGNVVATPTLNSVGTVTYYAEAQDNTPLTPLHPDHCSSLTRTPVVLTIDTHPATPVKDAGSDITICETNSGTTIMATITTPPGITINWYTSPTGGLPVSPTLSSVGTQTFYAEASNGNCVSTGRSAGVVLTIQPAPLPPVSGGNITQCIDTPAQTLTPTATAPVGSTVAWYDAPSGGNLVAAPSLTGLGTQTFYAESVNNVTGCRSLTRRAVTLTIINHPLPPVAANQTVCETSPLQTLIPVATVPSGSTVKWFTTPTGGTPVIAPSYSGIGSSTYFAETDNGICTSLTRTPVTLRILPAPLAPVSTGPITQCETTPIVPLDATNAIVPVAGVVFDWYDSSTSGNKITVPKLSIPGTATYYAEARNTTTNCTSLTRTGVTLTINPTPGKPVWLKDIRECVKSAVQTLNANDGIEKVTGVTYTWYDAAVGGIITTPTLNSVGSKTFWVEAKTGSCPNLSRTAVKLTLDDAPPTPVSSGNITECYSPTMSPLTAKASSPGVPIDWYLTPTGGSPVPSPTLDEVGTITYYAEANNGTCVSLARSAGVVLTILAAPAPPVVGEDTITVCVTNPIQKLTAIATVPTGVTIVWYDAATGGNTVADPSLNLIGTKSYWAEAKIGNCVSARTKVTLKINPAPARPTPIITPPACEQSPIQTLTAKASIPGAPASMSYLWYSTPTGGSPVNPTLSEVGTATYYAEANDGTCSSIQRSVPVVLTINPTPKDLVSLGDVTECITNPAQLLEAKVQVPDSGTTITWYDKQTNGSKVGLPTLNKVGTKTYWAEATINTCKSLNRIPVVLTINNAPAAPLIKGNITACEDSTAIQTLTANDALSNPTAIVRWYDAPTLGFEVVPELSSIGTVTYYAEARDNVTDCPSVTRTPVVLTINPLPIAPVSSGNITECATTPVQTLDANTAITVPSGTKVQWYDLATGGNVVLKPILKAVGTSTYYAEVIDNLTGCVSATRTAVVLTINSHSALPVYAGTGNGVVESCETAPIVQLDARDYIIGGNTLTWYDASSAGFVVANPILDKVGTVTFYTEAIANGCGSISRVPVKMTIYPAPPIPISKGDIRDCAKNTAQLLDANTAITNLSGGYTTIWYKTALGTDTITHPTLIATGDSVTYYATFKDNLTNCESLQRTAVKLSIAPPASAASNSPLSVGETLNLTGGPDGANLTYTWLTPIGGTLSGMNVSIPNVTVDLAGYYKLTVTDANGCSSYDSTKVVIATTSAGFVQPVCLGSTLYLTGGPDLSGATYFWSGPNGFTSNEQNPSIDNTTVNNSGVYTLKVTDKNGIPLPDATVDVSFKPLPIVMVSSNSPVCPGGTLTLSGGPNGMSSYQWTSPSGPLPVGKNASVLNFNPTAPQKYALTVVDYFGCEATDTITATIFKPKASSNSPICQGDTLRLRALDNGMASYSWSGPNGYSSTKQNPVITGVTASAIGSYTLTVKDKSGCTSAADPINVSLNQSPPALTISMPGGGTTVCEGSSFSLDSGSSGMASYLWSGPNKFTSTQPNIRIPGISKAGAGTYTLKVTNTTGCSVTGKFTLTVISAAFNGIYGPYCTTDAPVTLSATPAGGTFSGTGVTGNVFDPSAAGVGAHSISYTSPGSCPVVPITIDVVLTAPVVKTNNISLNTCLGTADLTLPATTAGSAPGLIFTYWTDSGATQPIADPKAVVAGTYYIKGSTLSGNCFDIKPVVVDQSGVFQVKLLAVSPTCSGSATGSLEAVVTKGRAPYTYQWNTTPAQTTAKIKDLTAGIYTVTVSDSNLCSVTLIDTLRDHPDVKIYISRKDILCLSDANGSAKVDSINGSGKPSDLNLYTYKWNTTPVQNTREATRLSYGYHTVTMTDTKGCDIKDSVLINVLDSIPPTINCQKDTMTIIVQSPDPLSASPNVYVVDLGKPVVWDNCVVASLTNDAPEKYRAGITEVIWTVTDFVGLTATCKQVVYIKPIPVVPKLFSPNGDGINDYLEIDGLKDFPKSQLYVYTRSGQLVFSSEDYKNEWDGRFQTSKWSHNQIVAPGVYYYILNLGGITRKVQGFVYIYY